MRNLALVLRSHKGEGGCITLHPPTVIKPFYGQKKDRQTAVIKTKHYLSPAGLHPGERRKKASGQGALSRRYSRVLPRSREGSGLESLTRAATNARLARASENAPLYYLNSSCTSTVRCSRQERSAASPHAVDHIPCSAVLVDESPF